MVCRSAGAAGRSDEPRVVDAVAPAPVVRGRDLDAAVGQEAGERAVAGADLQAAAAVDELGELADQGR